MTACHVSECSRRPPIQPFIDGALGIATLRTNPYGAELASSCRSSDRLRMHLQKLGKLTRRVMPLDQAFTCSFIGSAATFVGFFASSWSSS
jgi:hypothetical protein